MFVVLSLHGAPHLLAGRAGTASYERPDATGRYKTGRTA